MEFYTIKLRAASEDRKSFFKCLFKRLLMKLQTRWTSDAASAAADQDTFPLWLSSHPAVRRQPVFVQTANLLRLCVLAAPPVPLAV